MLLVILMLASSALVLGVAVARRVAIRTMIPSLGYALLIALALAVAIAAANQVIVLHYLEQLADQTGVRREWAWGATWFIALAVSHFVGKIFSIHKAERLIGEIGLASIVAVFFFIKITGTAEELIGQCIAWDESGVRRYPSQQVDRISGLPCVLITPQNQAQLRPLLHRTGLGSPAAGPARISNGPFFVSRFGSDEPVPIAWYSRADDGRIELWDMFGVHPILGTRLQPITPTVAREWERQNIRPPDQRVEKDVAARTVARTAQERVTESARIPAQVRPCQQRYTDQLNCETVVFSHHSVYDRTAKKDHCIISDPVSALERVDLGGDQYRYIGKAGLTAQFFDLPVGQSIGNFTCGGKRAALNSTVDEFPRNIHVPQCNVGWSTTIVIPVGWHLTSGWGSGSITVSYMSRGEWKIARENNISEPVEAFRYCTPSAASAAIGTMPLLWRRL